MIEEKKTNSFKYLNNHLNLNDNIFYHLYIDRDYIKSLSLLNTKFEKLRSKELKDKHRCNRNPFCECIMLGLTLVEIFEYHSLGKSLTSSMEEYYYFIHFIPYKIIKAMIRSCLKKLDFMETKRIIDTYLTYSTFPEEVTQENNKASGSSLFTYKLNLPLSIEEVIDYVYFSIWN